jgi:hypothetical protein
MGRKLRYIPEGGALVEVTCRTLHGRLLLRPSPELNDIAAGILGRAQRLYPVDLVAFQAVSNHFLCAAPHNMCYVERSVMWSCRPRLNQVEGMDGGDCTYCWNRLRAANRVTQAKLRLRLSTDRPLLATQANLDVGRGGSEAGLTELSRRLAPYFPAIAGPADGPPTLRIAHQDPFSTRNRFEQVGNVLAGFVGLCKKRDVFRIDRLIPPRARAADKTRSSLRWRISRHNFTTGLQNQRPDGLSSTRQQVGWQLWVGQR